MTNGRPPEVFFHCNSHIVQHTSQYLKAWNIYLADEPFNLVPGMCFPVPDAVIDPLAGIFGQLLAVFLHKDGIRRSNVVSHLIKTW